MKIAALYALQGLVGVVALAVGYAKLTGIGVMTEPLELIGLGQGFRIVAGSIEMAGGLCLLFPRSGVIGAVLLTSVMIGMLGATIGHAASPQAAAAPRLTAVHVKGWDI
jgi:uncharacterized membrane protein